MAKRPVFYITDRVPYVLKSDVIFDYYSGFSISQKQKSFKELHKNFLKLNPSYRILEISSKSDNPLGVSLSAFNLKVKTSIREFTVETAFQSSKVFEYGGPYLDLLEKSSIEAKKDERLKNSGKLIEFNYFGKKYQLEPKDYFYNWLYINSLYCNKYLINDLMNYNAFTDIEFNPDKSINCQAKAVALFVSLNKKGLIEQALKSQEDFLEIVYGKNNKNDEYIQNTLPFDNADISMLNNIEFPKSSMLGEKKYNLSTIYNDELSEISYLLSNLENGRIYEKTGWMQDGYLSTNIQKLRTEIIELLCKIQNGDNIEKAKIRDILNNSNR